MEVGILCRSLSSLLDKFRRNRTNSNQHEKFR
jgi:hypothetical protein